MTFTRLILARIGSFAVFLSMLSGGATFAAGSTEFVIYSFPHSAFAAGCQPQGNLVADTAGNLYGTAACGALSQGVVFQLTRPAPPITAWTESLLYTFTGGSDGAFPLAGVIFDTAGNIYGTTSKGGAFGDGTVFELTPPATSGSAWTESVLHSFQGGGIDGTFPETGLVWDKSGNLNGVTFSGGSNRTGCTGNCGIVFQLSPPATAGGAWTETIIHNFSYGQGAFPRGTPIFDAKGNLYGTTYLGGKYGDGVAYTLVPPATAGGTWAYRVLHAFGGGTLSDPESTNPFSALTIHGKGILYGTTIHGGLYGSGTVFQLVPPAVSGSAWTENILYNFSFAGGGTDGAAPAANVIFDSAGNIYGTTTGGGGGLGCACGTVFQLAPPATVGAAWTETVLHSFPSST